MKIFVGLLLAASCLLGDSLTCTFDGAKISCAALPAMGINLPDHVETLSYDVQGNTVTTRADYGSPNAIGPIHTSDPVSHDISYSLQIDERFQLPATSVANDYYRMKFAIGDWPFPLCCSDGEWTANSSVHFDNGFSATGSYTSPTTNIPNSHCFPHTGCSADGIIFPAASIGSFEYIGSLFNRWVTNDDASSGASQLTFRLTLERFHGDGTPDPFMTATPEPASFALAFSGLAFAVIFGLRRRCN